MQARAPANNSLDLAVLQQDLLWLAEAVDRAIVGATWALGRRDPDEARRVLASGMTIQELRGALEQRAILLLAGQMLVAYDARRISAAMLIAAELERIGDYAAGIATMVLRIMELPPLGAPPALGQMAHKSREMLQHAIRAVIRCDADVAARLERADDTIDQLYQRMLHEALQTMREHPEHSEWAIYLLWAGHNLERIADRAINIAQRAAFVATGELVPRQARRVPAAPLP